MYEVDTNNDYILTLAKTVGDLGKKIKIINYYHN